MARLGLRRRREQRLGQPLGLPQARRARRTRRPCPALRTPASRRRTGSRARRTRAGSAASTARAWPGPRRRRRSPGSRSGRRRSRGSRRCRCVRSNQKCDRPVSTRPLSGISSGQHDVEHRDAVARDHQQPVVADLVELAHLARVEVRQRGRCHVTSEVPERVQRVEDAAGVGERALEVEAGVEARRVERARSRRGPRARIVAERSVPLATRASRCAAPCRYASSRVVPDSTSASSTGWLNTSPNDESMLRSMRSG